MTETHVRSALSKKKNDNTHKGQYIMLEIPTESLRLEFCANSQTVSVYLPNLDSQLFLHLILEEGRLMLAPSFKQTPQPRRASL